MGVIKAIGKKCHGTSAVGSSVSDRGRSIHPPLRIDHSLSLSLFVHSLSLSASLPLSLSLYISLHLVV